LPASAPVRKAVLLLPSPPPTAVARPHSTNQQPAETKFIVRILLFHRGQQKRNIKCNDFPLKDPFDFFESWKRKTKKPKEKIP
jgi:hypothetical protein